MASRDLKPGQGVGARNAFGSKRVARECKSNGASAPFETSPVE